MLLLKIARRKIVAMDIKIPHFINWSIARKNQIKQNFQRVGSFGELLGCLCFITITTRQLHPWIFLILAQFNCYPIFKYSLIRFISFFDLKDLFTKKIAQDATFDSAIKGQIDLVCQKSWKVEWKEKGGITLNVWTIFHQNNTQHSSPSYIKKRKFSWLDLAQIFWNVQDHLAGLTS